MKISKAMFVGVLLITFAPLALATGEKVLYSFISDADGDNPVWSGNLVSDSAGNLYGTTVSGGTYGALGGTAFELSPSKNGWTKTVLYNFGKSGDAANPESGLVFDAVANLIKEKPTGHLRIPSLEQVWRKLSAFEDRLARIEERLKPR